MKKRLEVKDKFCSTPTIRIRLDSAKVSFVQMGKSYRMCPNIRVSDKLGQL